MIPLEPLKGKEFEELVLFRGRKLEAAGILSLGRFGTTVSMMRDPYTQEMKLQPMPSLPDFDGCIAPTGRQLIIETKVCSQASYPLLNTAQKNPKQIDYMMLREKFGALCYLLIHFNGRSLVKMQVPAETYAIPVIGSMELWRLFDAGVIKSITREDAALHGIPVPWNLWSSRARNTTPDLTVLLPS